MKGVTWWQALRFETRYIVTHHKFGQVLRSERRYALQRTWLSHVVDLQNGTCEHCMFSLDSGGIHLKEIIVLHAAVCLRGWVQDSEHGGRGGGNPMKRKTVVCLWCIVGLVSHLPIGVRKMVTAVECVRLWLCVCACVLGLYLT